MTILLDSDALVAISKVDDLNHQKALKIFSKIDQAIFYISQFTIPEVVTVLSHKVSQKSAKLFLENINDYGLSIIPLSEELIDATNSIFLSQSKNNTSWCDCLNVAIIKYYSMEHIFSFDKFYKKFDIDYC